MAQDLMRHIGKIAQAMVTRADRGLKPGQRDRAARLLTEFSQGGRSGELEPFMDCAEVLATEFAEDIVARTGRPVGAIAQSSCSSAGWSKGLGMFLARKGQEQQDVTGDKALALFRSATVMLQHSDSTARAALALEINISLHDKPKAAHPLEGFLDVADTSVVPEAKKLG